MLKNLIFTLQWWMIWPLEYNLIGKMEQNKRNHEEKLKEEGKKCTKKGKGE